MRKWLCLMSCLIIVLMLALPVFAEESGETSTQPPHTHSWGTGTGSDSTCTQPGSKTYTCSCGETKTEQTPALGHSFGAWSQGDAANHTRTCSNCGTAESAAHAYDFSCDTDCNVCGAVRTVSHSKVGGWNKNASGHWHDCSLCKAQLDFGKHYPGPAATEQEAQLCLTCGYTLTAQLIHEHSYSNAWISDESGHWYACSGCQEKKDFQIHDYEDECDPDCNICGFQTGNAHSFDGSWHSDEEGHWFVCLTCGSVVESREHTIVAEEEKQICTDCGYVVSKAAEHVHTFEASWQTDESSHWQKCACGETSDKKLHVWDEGTEEEDTILYTCTECGAQQTEELPAEEDSFPWEIVFAGLLVALACAVAALIYVLKGNRKKKRM